MTYGFRVVSDAADNIVVDEERTVLSYLGTVSLTSDPITYSPFNHTWTHYGDITSPSRPLLFMDLPSSSADAAAIMNVVNTSGSTWRVYVAVKLSGAAPTIRAFARNEDRGASSDANGIRVFNSAGDVVFDSGYRNLWLPVLVSGELALSGITTGTPIGLVNDAINFTVTLAGRSMALFTRDPVITLNTGAGTATIYHKLFYYSNFAGSSNNEYLRPTWSAVFDSAGGTYTAFNGASGGVTRQAQMINVSDFS